MPVMSSWKRAKAYLDLCRVSNMPTVWTNVLAALAVSGTSWETSVYLTLAGSFSCFYAAGMALNDIWDADVDRLTRPTRPIPSGRVSVRSAWIITVFLFCAAVLLLLVQNLSAILAGFVLLIMIVAYDKVHKNKAWSVFLMAACRLLIFVIAGLSVLDSLTWSVWLAGLSQFAYVLMLSAVARFEGNRKYPLGAPIIPIMIAGISLVDAAIIILSGAAGWMSFCAGAGAPLTLMGQRWIKGD